MLPNGLLLTLDMALRDMPASLLQRSEASGDDDWKRHYGLWVLGMFREDVVLYPGLEKATPSPSGGHIWPFASSYFRYRYALAVWAMRRGQLDLAHFNLGRALHVLIDMACPSHSHPAWHCSRDPFERYVESHAAELALAEVPVVSLKKQTPWCLVRNLIKAARALPADHTQSPWGRWLRRKGWLKKPDGRELAQQTRLMIPLAAAHVRLMFHMYERDTQCLIVSTA